MGGEEEEMAIEQQLELQLQEQKDSLSAIVEALESEPSNQELLSVHEELVGAIKDAEEGLLHLKRSRLLREVDAATSKHLPESEDIFAESVDGEQSEIESVESNQLSIGAKCRFRHSDGRWYHGCIIGLENATSVRISFLIPTSESMLMCKFFLQDRCRFGNNCRMSHGVLVPVSSLKPYIPTIWHKSLVGSSIVAAPNGPRGLWKVAELQSWDDRLKLAHVVFEDGNSAKVCAEALEPSEYAQLSEEEEFLSSEESESDSVDASFADDPVHEGLGFLDTAKLHSGVQKETALFATWENHTRGIASKLMANMGYREGMGLGVSGQGIVDPVSVRVLPPKQSLDHALESHAEENGKRSGKKRSRGGRRKREKKYAEAARAAKAEQEPESDVFNFINVQLAGHPRDSVGPVIKQSKAHEVENSTKKEDRRSLVAYEDKIKELHLQVERLEGTLRRNQNDKVVYEAASRRLREVRKALADAEEAHASASHAVVSKEKEKRWLKF